MSTLAAAKNRRKKLLATLGVKPQDLFNKCLTVGAGVPVGTMPKEEYSMFWDSIENISETTWFLCELATQITKMIEAGNIKSSSSSSSHHQNPLHQHLQVDVGHQHNQHAGQTSASPNGPASALHGAHATHSTSHNSHVGQQPISLESLLTSFGFVLQSMDFLPQDKRVKDALAAWAKVEAVQTNPKNAANQHLLFNQAKEIFRVLSLIVENGELLGRVILNAISMYASLPVYEKMCDILSHPTIDDSTDLKCGESSFYYEYIKKIAKEGIVEKGANGKPAVAAASSSASSSAPSSSANSPQVVLQLILANIIPKITALPQQMKMNPKIAETTFCALFHLLRNLMCLHAITDTNFLRDTLSKLQPFDLWPQPYGQQTREMMHRIREELVFSGSLMRTRIEQEIYTTPYVDNELTSLNSLSGSPLSSSSAHAHSSLTPSPPSDLSSGLFYLHSLDDKVSSSYIHLLDLKAFKLQTLRKSPGYVWLDGVPALCTPGVQAMTILNVFSTEPTFLSGIPEDIANIKLCTNEELYSCYRKLRLMMKDVQEKPNEARELRVKCMNEIRTELKRLAKLTTVKSKSELVRLPDKLLAPYTPSLPSISHLSISTKSIAYNFESRETWRMSGYKTTPFVGVPLQDELITLFGMYRDNNAGNAAQTHDGSLPAVGSRLRPLEMRIMIAGGDDMLHQVICAWCSIRQLRPEILDGIQPRFYLLPFQRNHLAAFIARHDAWYMRHVYTPARSSVFIAPWIRAEQDESQDGSASQVSSAGASQVSSPTFGSMNAPADDDQPDLTPPGTFLRRTIESYARDASLVIEPHIYQLEGFLTPDSEGLRPQKSSGAVIPGPDHLIPFIQRAEIGIIPYLTDWKRTRKIPDSTPYQDLKGFEYLPVELSVKFTKMDLAGRVRDTVHEDPTVYSSLVVSNVPRTASNTGIKGDIVYPANPCASNLELGARLHKLHNSQKSISLGRKNILASEPRQHIIEIEIWATKMNDTFHIMLDGQLFGPYFRIKLLSCYEPEGAHPALHTHNSITPHTPTHASSSSSPSNHSSANSSSSAAAAAKRPRMKFPIQTFFPMSDL